MISPPPESQSSSLRKKRCGGGNKSSGSSGRGIMSEAYQYSRSLSIAHKRRLIGTAPTPAATTTTTNTTYKPPQLTQQETPVSDTDGDMDMKVDSPGDMNDDRLLRSKALVIGDDNDNNENEDSNSNAIDTDDDDVVVADPEDEEFGPPRKRLCRGTQSALSLALRGASITSFSKPILVRVGPPDSSQDFHIHEANLANSSPYFESLFEKLHEEDPSADLLDLPDDDPLIFSLYAQYIYNPSSISDLELGTDNASTTDSLFDPTATYVDLLHAYIFGEKVQNADFQNEVMNRILECIRDIHNQRSASSSESIVRPLIEQLYPSLPPDSIGRGLAVESFIVLWSHSDRMQLFVPALSRELLTEIAEMLLSGDKDHIRDAWAQAINGDYSYYHSARSDEH